jgi:hypothetical protein
MMGWGCADPDPLPAHTEGTNQISHGAYEIFHIFILPTCTHMNPTHPEKSYSLSLTHTHTQRSKARSNANKCNSLPKFRSMHGRKGKVKTLLVRTSYKKGAHLVTRFRVPPNSNSKREPVSQAMAVTEERVHLGVTRTSCICGGLIQARASTHCGSFHIPSQEIR